jgi:hypothetical protein
MKEIDYENDQIVEEVARILLIGRASDLDWQDVPAAATFLDKAHGIRGIDAQKIYRIAKHRANRRWDGVWRKEGAGLQNVFGEWFR